MVGNHADRCDDRGQRCARPGAGDRRAGRRGRRQRCFCRGCRCREAPFRGEKRRAEVPARDYLPLQGPRLRRRRGLPRRRRSLEGAAERPTRPCRQEGAGRKENHAGSAGGGRACGGRGVGGAVAHGARCLRRRAGHRRRPMALSTYADAARAAVQHAMAEDSGVVVLGEDVGRGGIFQQYKGLQQEFGAARVIDTPISEATIMGAAVGMALAGLKPVVEMRVVDFALCAMDEIVNQAAKARYMFGGQGRVPLVARLPIGLWSGSAAQHSQSLEAWFAHMPGLVVVAPSTPQDNYSLLRASIDCGDPVIYMEHKELWGLQGDVKEESSPELAKARVLKKGTDLTLVTWSRMVHAALEAAEKAASVGISAEVIDLRTIWPWDRDLVFASAARTRRLLVAHEAVRTAGFGAEIAAEAAEHLGVPVKRLG